jgi:transcriptional pleiotropic regulator of transition state genes
MTVSKRLNSKGGVTIPQQLRHAAGIVPGAPLDIEDAGDGLIIRKHVPSCSFCSSVENVVIVQGVEICAVCAAQLSDAAKEKLEATYEHGQQ